MSAKIENIGISVSNPIYFQNFRIRVIAILLSVIDIGQFVYRQYRTESIPLIQVECSLQDRKFIIRIYRYIF